MAEMNSVEKAVLVILRADVPIASVVGTRIHHDHLPQDTLRPAVAYKLISDNLPTTHDGFIGPAKSRIQVTAHAVDYATARTLAAKISTAMLNNIGTFAGIIVQGIFHEGLAALYDDDPAVKEHFVPTDFMVHYTP